MKTILCTLTYTCLLYLTVNGIQLDSGPVDARVKVGSDATFECFVSDVSPYRLYWVDETRNFITWGNIVYLESKYSIISSSYGLKISNVQPTDAGAYECQFSYDNIYYHFRPRARATLTVLQPPSANSPQCALIKDYNMVLPETPFYIGETVRLHCSSQGHGNTQPRLNIMISNLDIAEYVLSEVPDKKEVWSGDIKIENTETELQCYLDSEALEKLRVCKIRPVVLTPTVMIQPTTMSAFELTSISFQCSGNNFKTTNLQYEWQVSPYVPGEVISFTSQVLNISDIAMNSTESSLFFITCLVREGNIVRNSSSSLFVVRNTTVFPTTTSNNINNIDKIKKDNSESSSVTATVFGILITIVFVAAISFIIFHFRKTIRNKISGDEHTNTVTSDLPPAYYEIKNRNTSKEENRNDSTNDNPVYYSTVAVENNEEYNNYDRVDYKPETDDPIYENKPSAPSITELNVEGLNYADLDLGESTSHNLIKSENKTVYSAVETNNQ